MQKIVVKSKLKNEIMKKSIYFLALFVLTLSACTEELIEDHIEGTWQLETYKRNNADETTKVKIVSYEETYSLDGTFSRTYIDGNQEPVAESGTFSINEDNSTLHISDVSSISEFSDEHSTLSTSTAEVLIIDETEYAYTFDNGGDTHEFIFTRKE